MASKKELRALITLAGKIDPSLQTAMLKATGDSKKLSENLKHASKSAGSFKQMMAASFVGNLASNAVTALATKISELSRNSIKLASDLDEVQNVVDTTFTTSSKQINAWSKTALKAYGLSELQAKQFAGTMGAMLKSSGIAHADMDIMATKLAGLAGDFSSFYDIEHEEAWTKIRAGISGETEPLKQLGINMSVANLEAFALSKGIKKSFKDMSQGEQTLLRYNYLMKVSKDVQGDFNKTQDSYSNQQRLFNTNLQQVSATIASKALPHLTSLLQVGNEFINNLDIDKAVNTATTAFNFMGDAIKFVCDNSNILIPVITGTVGTIGTYKIISSVTGLMDMWRDSTFAQTLAQEGLNVALKTNPIGLVITGVGLLISLLTTLEMKFGLVTKAVNAVSNAFKRLKDWKINIAGTREGNDLLANSTVSAEYADMPQFALGGIATRPSIFGEAGIPEMAIPLQKTPRSLSLLNQTAQILGGKSGGSSASFEINIYSSDGNAKSIGDELREVVEDIIEKYFDNKGRVSFE